MVMGEGQEVLTNEEFEEFGKRREGSLKCLKLMTIRVANTLAV